MRPHSVAVAVLTCDRPDDVSRLVTALAEQQAPIETVVVVDNGLRHCELPPVVDGLTINHIKSESNLGGAGGFSLAILTALSTSAEWIWVMDDDARPENDRCLATLLDEATRRGLSAVSPIIVAPEDDTRLSFPFRVDGKLSYDRAEVERVVFRPGEALLFNGLLIRREALFEVGLPDLKMFIRGDEVDFLLRLRRSGLGFGTVSNAAFTHPTGWAEVHPLVQDRYHLLIPETAFKRYYFFRNRGYLARRYRRPASLLADLVGYAMHYLVRRRDVAGFREWRSAFAAGLRGDFSDPHSRRSSRTDDHDG